MGWRQQHGSENMGRFRSIVLGKGMFFRLHLNESRQNFCRRGSGRSFHVDGPKTEKAREPTVERLVLGIWRLRVSEAERRVREGVQS